MTEQDILTLKNAVVFRGSHKVFNGLNLSLRCGEHTAILGPNGAGKTTLLKLITRELRPVVNDNTQCLLFGQTLFNLWDLRKKIGVVSHDVQNDYRSLATGLEVVLSAYFGSVGIHGHHRISESQRAAALELMAEMAITDLAERRYLELSTGQQRRLLLARALLHKPQALVFDEPTAGLDLGSAMQLLNELRRLTQNNVTLILVTHHLHEIIPEISRVVLLDRGEICGDGPKAEVLTSERISQLYKTPVNIDTAHGYYQVTPA